MKKIRNDKIDGRWCSDEYIHELLDTIDEKNKIIEKAIEYIENHSLNFNGECEWELSIEECKELEDILKGEDNK